VKQSKKILGLIIFFCLSSLPSLAERINFVSLVPGEGQLRNTFIETEKRLEENWNGQADIVLLIDGQVGTEESMISTVRRGRSHLSLLTIPGTSIAVPEMSLLMAPFLFDSYEEADFVLDNYVILLIKKLYAKKGLQFIQWHSSGWFNVFSVMPLTLPEELKGIRMRAAGGPAARVFFQQAGADVTQMPFSDLVPGLQTGLVKGGATNTPMYRTVALYELAPYITLTRHSINPGTVFANKKWFDGLKESNQKLVMKGLAPTKIVRKEVRQESEDALEFSSKKGATIIQLSETQRKRWKKATEKSHQIIIEEIGEETDLLYDLILEGKDAFKIRSNTENNHAKQGLH